MPGAREAVAPTEGVGVLVEWLVLLTGHSRRLLRHSHMLQSALFKILRGGDPKCSIFPLRQLVALINHINLRKPHAARLFPLLEMCRVQCLLDNDRALRLPDEAKLLIAAVLILLISLGRLLSKRLPPGIALPVVILLVGCHGAPVLTLRVLVIDEV